MKIEIGRLLVMKAAWELDRGGFARKEVSMAKVQVANVLHEAADMAIQINGARGYSKDTVLEWIYRYARQARLVDGADEVHRMVLNRVPRTEGQDNFWRWRPGRTKLRRVRHRLCIYRGILSTAEASTRFSSTSLRHALSPILKPHEPDPRILTDCCFGSSCRGTSRR